MKPIHILWAALAAIAIHLAHKTIQLMKSTGQTPLCPPVTGPVSSRFSEPRTGHTHNGTDIAVPVGTPVRTPWAGTAAGVYNDTQYGGGLTVIIKHANGWRTGYCHLSTQDVAQGAAVEAGQVIAHSGNTGHSTGPHLHFTLTNPQGQKVDPEQYFEFQA